MLFTDKLLIVLADHRKSFHTCAPSGHFSGCLMNAAASWSAVAERSGDTAFGRTGDFRPILDFRACESGVALRFPPQSMTRWVGGRLARGGAAFDGRIKFLAAGAAGARALAGGRGNGHGGKFLTQRRQDTRHEKNSFAPLRLGVFALSSDLVKFYGKIQSGK